MRSVASCNKFTSHGNTIWVVAARIRELEIQCKNVAPGLNRYPRRPDFCILAIEDRVNGAP